jgi:hypothetical protein
LAQNHRFYELLIRAIFQRPHGNLKIGPYRAQGPKWPQTRNLSRSNFWTYDSLRKLSSQNFSVFSVFAILANFGQIDNIGKNWIKNCAIFVILFITSYKGKSCFLTLKNHIFWQFFQTEIMRNFGSENS